VETTVYELRAALIKARWVWDRSPSKPLKEKGDRDIHLAIAAPSNHALTMIVEFPDPACVEAAPGLKKMMRDARNAFLDCKGLMPSANKRFQPLSGQATINGVGFFDRPHANGHAPHGSSCTRCSSSVALTVPEHERYHVSRDDECPTALASAVSSAGWRS